MNNLKHYTYIALGLREKEGFSDKGQVQVLTAYYKWNQNKHYKVKKESTE